MTSRHAIGSLEFELTLAQHREAVAVQNRIAALTEQEVPRRIERVLDRFDRPDRTLRLDRIELDLGRVDHDALEATLLESLERELVEALERCTRRVPEPDRTPRGLSRQAHTLADLSFFLRTGSLPWSTDPERFVDLAARVEELLAEPPAALDGELRRLFGQSAARLRLITNLPEPLLDRLVIEVLGAGPGPLEALRAQLDAGAPAWSAAALPPDRKTLRYVPLLRAASRLAGTRPSALLSHWLDEAFDVFTAAAGPRSEAIEHAIEALDGAHTPPSSPAAAVIESLARLRRRVTDPAATRSDAAAARTTPAGADDLASGVAPVAVEPAEILRHGLPDPTAGDERVEAPSWLVRNAGLVLLWPYLPRYFEGIGLVAEDAFVTRNDARRALHELQYLAVGDRPYREYDLVLNKVLCGVPLDEPTAFDPDFRHRHREDAEELLLQVIAHWPRVGSMSVDGLRGSFLLRAGKLTRCDSGYTLQVERTGFDVLLDGLSHPISVLRLPWMTEVVHVEW